MTRRPIPPLAFLLLCCTISSTAVAQTTGTCGSDPTYQILTFDMNQAASAITAVGLADPLTVPPETVNFWTWNSAQCCFTNTDPQNSESASLADLGTGISNIVNYCCYGPGPYCWGGSLTVGNINLKVVPAGVSC